MEETGIIGDRYLFNENKKKNKKKLSFNNTKRVCLIPYYYEICNEMSDLWWHNSDFLKARHSSVSEILQLLENHPSMEIKQAIKLLYQPNAICYNPENFED